MNLKEAVSIKNLIIDKKVKFLVSFQRRFHPLVIKLREIILENQLGKISNVKISTKSYVPDWHPYENFRDLYACRKELGGGVVPTEIHEVDIITWIFGKPEAINVKSSNISDYNLDVEDTASIILYYDNLVINADISFMSKEAQREIIFKGEKGTIKLDLLEQELSVCELNSKEYITTENLQNDQLFDRQLDFFLNDLDSQNNPYLDSIINNSMIIERR